VPIRVKDVATVQLGPEFRRSALEKDGREAVGGVVMMRYGGNPLAVTDAIKLPRPDAAPYPAGILEALKEEEVHVPEAGLVDEAAVHEIPALPSDEEVAAIAAEQEAGAAAEAEAQAAAAEEAVQKAQSDEAKPEADESKEG